MMMFWKDILNNPICLLLETNGTTSNSTMDERKVPKSLEEIVRLTKFTKSEIRLLYKGFKQVRWHVRVWCFLWFFFLFSFVEECPSGAVTEREFQTIYSHFFPHGNCQNYTSFLFRLLDRRKRMYFTFEVRSFLLDKRSTWSLAQIIEGLCWSFIYSRTRKCQRKITLDLSFLWYWWWWQIDQTRQYR